jgi:sensor histidine kinase YesM
MWRKFRSGDEIPAGIFRQTLINNQAMNAITKRSARLIALLKKDIVQHLSFAAFVFVIIFCCLAIFAWYQGKAELLETIDYQRQAFWRILIESLLFTLFLGVPVNVCLLLVYKGRFQLFFHKRIWSDRQLKGWGFYWFLFFSSLVALGFGWLYAFIFPHIFSIIDPTWYVLAAIIFILSLCITGASFSIESIEKNRELERMARQEAIRKQREAERQLAFIKKQIRPHFLFNTLTNLQILAKQKSDDLPELMGQLTHLLRHLIYRTDDALVPLERELEFITSYIKLQELSMAKDTKLSLCIDSGFPAYARIAPMILLIFVENCFKHYDKRSSRQKLIEISIRHEEGLLVLETCNTFKPNTQNEAGYLQEEGSVGVKSALENLQLIYGDRFVYRSEVRDRLYCVHLEIPLS